MYALGISDLALTTTTQSETMAKCVLFCAYTVDILSKALVCC